MAIFGPGCMGIGASNIAAWRSFAANVPGAAVTGQPEGGRSWRPASNHLAMTGFINNIENAIIGEGRTAASVSQQDH